MVLGPGDETAPGWANPNATTSNNPGHDDSDEVTGGDEEEPDTDSGVWSQLD